MDFKGNSNFVELRASKKIYYKPSVSCSVMSDSLQPMDCSLPGSSVHGICQARVLEWGAIAIPTILTTSKMGAIIILTLWMRKMTKRLSVCLLNVWGLLWWSSG